MIVTLIKRTCLDNVRYLPVKLFFLSLSLCVTRHSSLRGEGGLLGGDRYVHPSPEKMCSKARTWDVCTSGPGTV